MKKLKLQEGILAGGNTDNFKKTHVSFDKNKLTLIIIGLTQTGVQSETKCSFVATKFRYATLWTPILAVLRKSYIKRDILNLIIIEELNKK